MGAARREGYLNCEILIVGDYCHRAEHGSRKFHSALYTAIYRKLTHLNPYQTKPRLDLILSTETKRVVIGVK